MTKKEQNAILEIARRNLPAMEQRGDFETRMNDTEDFLEVSVWSLRAALEEAYELGRAAGKKN